MMVCYENISLVEIISIWIQCEHSRMLVKKHQGDFIKGNKSITNISCGNIVNWASFNMLGAFNVFTIYLVDT
jgi:hypothetical protein